ncbi:MAG: hypothetical protein ABIA47_02405 [bacterium]
MKKQGGIYKKIFTDSWRVAWTHKELWPVAIAAGLVNTGAVFNGVMESFLRVRPADQVDFETLRYIVDAAPWLALYIKSTLTLEPMRIAAILIVLFIIIAVVAIVVISAQQMLITGALSVRKNRPLSLKGQFKALRHMHFWRILAVDIGLCISTCVLISLSSLALAALLTGAFGIDLFVFAGIYTILLPLLFALNLLGMFALINVVRLDKGIIKALTRGLKLLHGHWLASLEVALGLFIINLIATIALWLILIIYAIPAILIFIVAFNTGSMLLFSVVSFIAALGALLIVLAYSGAITTFNHAVWIQLMERLERYGAMPHLERMFAKINKLFRK